MVVSDLKEKLEQKGIVPIDGIEKLDDFYIEKGKELARKINPAYKEVKSAV